MEACLLLWFAVPGSDGMLFGLEMFRITGCPCCLFDGDSNDHVGSVGSRGETVVKGGGEIL